MSSTEHIQATDCWWYILLPSSTQNVFLTFTYDSTYTWRGNSVGYIIKFFTTSSIFFIGVSSNFILLKMTYSSSWLLCTSKNIQVLYINTPCNILSCLSMCIHFFFFPRSITHHFHDILYWKYVGLWSFSSTTTTCSFSICLICQNLME